MKKKSGHLIFIGSQAALPGAKQVGNVTYTATKGALHAVVGPLAREYGPSIRINCIAPGDVCTETELIQLRKNNPNANFELLQRKVIERSALKRWVHPDEIAEAVLFLDRCNAMTGTILNISAGSSIH